VGRHQPPHGVNAEVTLGILVKRPLSSVLLLQLINVTLVFVYTLKLFSQNLVSEEREEDAFDESHNAHDEGNRVARSVHVPLSLFTGQQVVEGQEHQDGQVARGK